MDRVTARRHRVLVALAASLPLLAGWAMLGSQGARIGSWLVPALSPWWVAAATLVPLWLGRDRRGASASGSGLSRRGRLLAVGLTVTFLPLTYLWRASVAPPLDIGVTLGDGRTVQAATLQIPERRYLRRLTGERRDVTLEVNAALRVPVEGSYRFELRCDNACTIDIGPHRIEARGEARRRLALPEGEVPFRLHFRQRGGPAELLFAWDGPRLVEPLPIEHYLDVETGEAGGHHAERRRATAHAALLLLLLWWGAFAVSAVEIAPLARSRYVPIAAAALIGLYGSLLRVEAFLAHSGLADSSASAAAWHETLLPLTPAYAIFNPENAPEDPYRADVRSYLDRAESMRSIGSFYAPSFREPFYVALTKPFLAAAGGEIGILVQSLFFSILTLPLLYFLVYRGFGPWWALALLVPVALHEWLVLEAPSGYRMSAYGFFLLAFVGAVWRASSPVAAGLLGAALCLIRLSALSLVLPLIALKLTEVAATERRRYAVVAAALVLGLLAPFLASNLRAHGDPFYAVSFHTEFWLRAEGLDDGQGAVGLTRYVTDFGRSGELVRGTVLGMTVLPLRTFLRGLARTPGPAPTLGLAVLVLAVLGSTLPRWYFLAAYLGHLLPFAYIQNFPSGEMPRFVMPAFLVLLLAAPRSAPLLRAARERLRL